MLGRIRSADSDSLAFLRHPTPDLTPEGDSMLDQRAELVSLRREMAALREDVAALTECLLRRSVLRPDSLAAAQHRYAFADLRRRHPFASEASLDAVLAIEGVAGRIRSYADGPVAGGYVDGPQAAACSSGLAARAASQSMASAARLAWPEGSRQQGVRIRLCGGAVDGASPTNAAEVLDVAAGVWKVQPPMPAGRSGAAAAVMLRGLYVCGGSLAGVATPTVDRFDPEADEWEAALPMLEARQGAAAAGFSDEFREGICVCGGWNEAGQHLRTAECLSAPAVEAADGPPAWTPLPSMASRRTRPAAGALGRILYVCGGWCEQERLSSVERFDPRTQMWHAAPSMLTPRDAAVAGVAAGVLYVCGGWAADGSVTKTAERFHPEHGAWEGVAAMFGARCGAASVAAAGRLYVFGGYDGAQYLPTCEVLNPIWGVWVELPPLSAPRWAAAAGAVREGRSGR